MATFNPYLQTDLRHIKAQGAAVDDRRDFNGKQFRWTGVDWADAGSGGAAPGMAGASTDMSALTDFSSKLAGGRQTFNTQQAGQEQDFLGRFRGAIAGQEGLPAMYSRLGSELGLPGLQKSAMDTMQQYQNLPQTYQRATSGYDVNQNQMDRLVASKQAKLAPAVSATQMALQGARGQVNTQMGFEQQQQQKNLQPFQQESAMLSDRLARESTGYSQDMQSELDILIQKFQTGVQLSEAEKNRANQLAIAEGGWDIQKKQIEQQSQQQSQGPVSVGRYDSLIDPATGRLIYQGMGDSGVSNSAGDWG